MKMSVIVVLSLFLFCLGKYQKPQKVTKIPRYSKPIEGQYAGYVTTDESTGRHLYYLFVESTNASAPVILWLQGGPGCSGLMAYATEHGPITLEDDGTVVDNPYSLNKLGHVIYLDSPAGIGYSICEDHEAYVSGNDSRTADDIFKFLEVFFTDLFPQYYSYDFYLFGESYSGYYNTWVATKIFSEMEKGGFEINLKGMLMSNAVVNMHHERNSRPYWYFFHAVISQQEFFNGYTLCDGDFWENRNQTKCEAWLKNLDGELLKGINTLDLYTECYGGYSTGENDESVGCIDTNTSYYYFNSPEALDDFYVNIPLFNMTTKEWVECRDDLELFHNYKTIYWDVVPMLAEIVKKYNYFRVFMISGDVDNCVTSLANQWDMEEFLPEKALSQWDPWLYTSQELGNTQVGGFYRMWENFSFATIRGSGHMISTYKPHQAFLLYSRYLEGTFPY